MSNRLLIAYGSNLNRKQMSYRCPTAKLLGASTLRNHRLVFRGPHAAAVTNVEDLKGRSVPVLVWEITPADEAALDRYEDSRTCSKSDSSEFGSTVSSSTAWRML